MKKIDLIDLIQKKNKRTKRNFFLLPTIFKLAFYFFLIISILICNFVFKISDDTKKKMAIVAMVGIFLIILFLMYLFVAYLTKKKIKSKLLLGKVSVRAYKGVIADTKSEKEYSYVPYTRRYNIDYILIVQFENYKDQVRVPFNLYAKYKCGDEIYVLIFNEDKTTVSVFPCSNYYFENDRVLRETIYIDMEDK